jgi:multimeric flavodoxin WrbA
MKVIAFNGSARVNGNTATLVYHVFKELDKHGIETEMVQLAGKQIRGCTACGQCAVNKNQKCIIDSDIVNDCIKKMVEADAIILASPTYFANVSSEMKALIDRSGYVARANGNFLRRKVGASVVAARRGGGISVFNSLNYFFFIAEMIVPGSVYWNLGYGLQKGEVESDSEGIETMRVLGENMAWLLKKTHN